MDFRERIRKNQTAFRTLYTSNYVVDEVLTLLKRRCGVEVAVSFRDDLERSGLVRILWVERADEGKAWNLFRTHLDKGYSFTDCTSFALMESYSIRNVFCFDNHFRQFGLNTFP